MMYDDLSQSPLKELVNVEQRLDVTSEVNQVIIESRGFS
jgi:hypothetical protein